MDIPAPQYPKRMLALNREAMAHLLQGCDEHMPPARILEGLTGAQACEQHPEMPHSIAALLAHMTHWQDHTIGWLKGELPPPAPVEPQIDFPAVEPAQWDALLQRFLAGFEQLSALAGESSGEEFYKGRSFGFMLLMSGVHNTYHLGQIVLLRRLIGAWPPQGS